MSQLKIYIQMSTRVNLYPNSLLSCLDDYVKSYLCYK